LKKFFIFGELNKAGVVRASPPGETRENDTHQQPREKLTHSTENRVRTEPCQVHGTGPRREHVFPMPEFFFFLPPQRKGRGRNRISKKKKQADKQSVPVMRACVHMQARATALVTEGTHVT